MKWTVLYNRKIEDRVKRFRPSTKRTFAQAILDLQSEGPFPKGWDVKPLKGKNALRMKLDHRHRMIYETEGKILTIWIVEVTTREGAYR